MESTIEQTLKRGIAAHREGALQEAARMYEKVLKYQPANPDANHNLGLIAASEHKIDTAIKLFETAIKTNPTKDESVY